jgi:iron-sulfur cluster repair protein YtfE (RIC family)
MIIMKGKSRISSVDLAAARSTQFMHVVKRLKEEHAALEDKVTDLYIKAEQIYENRDISFTFNLLQSLRADVQMVMKELDAHEEWEEQEVYPMTSEYYKLQIRPSITPSIWVLEKEHERVKHCFQPFLALAQEIIIAIEHNDITIFKQLNLCVAYLLQGCSVLREHIELEAGLIYPLVDEILTDLGHDENQLTCGACGRIDKKRPVGTNWICEDCKEGVDNEST